jgi:hypothetical protein
LKRFKKIASPGLDPGIHVFVGERMAEDVDAHGPSPAKSELKNST